ncbi:MAG: ABC transporter ATP-binding protein, partial [Deltaproteobacteria bacterium]|nr:ABC transporter ATP-binding protein [Deltaproteobacteria bacterium]
MWRSLRRPGPRSPRGGPASSGCRSSAAASRSFVSTPSLATATEPARSSRSSVAAAAPLLEVAGLSVRFRTPRGVVQAVSGISLQVERGETVCLVGESGCGKSVTARAVLGLLPSPPALVEAERIVLAGEPMLGRTEQELGRIRGRKVGFVFQEPMVALNPV